MHVAITDMCNTQLLGDSFWNESAGNAVLNQLMKLANVSFAS